MAYSLTSASALGLDLVRTPGGGAVARLLGQGLLVEPGAAPVPATATGAGQDPAGARAAALRLLGERATVPAVDVRDDVVESRSPGTPARPVSVEELAETLTASLRRARRDLQAVSLGTVEDLLALARSLPVDATGRSGTGAPHEAAAGLAVREASDVRLGAALADGVLAELLLGCGDPALAPLARELLRPTVGGDLLPPVDSPGDAVEVPAAASLLRQVAAARPEALRTPDRPVPAVWARHVHDATWAIEITGRTRTAALAQLDLVRALHRAGVTPAEAAAGVWNTCSGAVQALVVADVLPDDVFEVLVADLLDALDEASGPA
ncbi:hypothetical protein [Aquipuribacter nitratireducens]|uniref:Uncharacterized protein n=1 Tax=Aquipuribacter nitratireducens TaxID=650104 RepID=A0ABW0GNG2_9MICO